uniref:peptidylprolyl isomerase n=1 Tax=Lotharella globosa TaxID=91324 RepID=A0A7S3YQN1_9EUKA
MGVCACVLYVCSCVRTRQKRPLEVVVGCGSVMQGWDIGIMTMQQGERSVLCISPEYGYGKYGKPPSIPANATLTYDVELLDWTDPPVMSQMSVAMFGFSLVLGIMAWSGLQS